MVGFWDSRRFRVGGSPFILFSSSAEQLPTLRTLRAADFQNASLTKKLGRQRAKKYLLIG